MKLFKFFKSRTKFDKIIIEMNRNKSNILDLSSLGLTVIPRVVFKQKHIKQLFLNGNRLSKISSDIELLTKLETLDISDNELKYFPLEILRLSNLKRLDIGNNNIKNLPKEIKNFKKIKILNLTNNLIEEIPEELNNLTKLKSNRTEIEWRKGLNLRGNNLNIPDEVFYNEPQELIEFILEIQKEKNKSRPWRECKLIVIGSGSVGKTSLIKRLTENDYDPNETITEGIEIKNWSLIKDGYKVHLHIWDFGGQEIMHATHKYFMTKRSVYLLVVNPRSDDRYGDSEIDYWLKLISSYAPNTPVIIAINKIDIHKSDYGKGALKDKFPCIIDFVETSCITSEGVEILKELILKSLYKIKELENVLPASYFKIKEKLELTNRDFIKYYEYRELCKSVDKDITETGMNVLVQLLNDVGIMLNIRENKGIEDTQVLNPEWITHAVYSIINNNKLKENNGIIRENDVSKILDNIKYPTSKERNFILETMEYFELCYKVPDTKDKYLVPGSFPKDKPINFKWNHEELLRFQYHYDVLPSSIISRFMVKNHMHIKKNMYWRSGVVLEIENTSNLIIADSVEKKIFIEIAGYGNKRSVLYHIRQEFDKIHHTIAKLNIKQFIPIVRNQIAALVDYDLLILMESKQKDVVFIAEFGEDVSIRSLLEGVEERYEKKSLKRLISINKFKEVFSILNNLFKDDNNLVMQLSRYNAINSKIITGEIDDINTEQNKIRAALLNFIDENIYDD